MNHKRIIEVVKSFVILHKKYLIIAGSLVACMIIGFIIFAVTRNEETVVRVDPEVKPPSEMEPAVTLVPSTLTGELVDDATATRPVTAVVIENSPEARPQSSLHEAGIVFEAIAEGGITRLVAMYQNNRPDPIGPVRSLRPYFVDWALMYDAPIAHVGGSIQALSEAQTYGIKDIDQFSQDSTFYRTSDRYAPHNVYTNFDLLDQFNNAVGFTDNSFVPFERKDDSPVDIPDASIITLDISSYLYRVDYRYDQGTNTYLRSIAGSPHVDKETEQQLAPKSIIALNIANRVIGNGRYEYDFVDSGTAQIFQDGTVVNGTWKRGSRYDQIELRDQSGTVIPLNRGQSWITALDIDQSAEYQP